MTPKIRLVGLVVLLPILTAFACTPLPGGVVRYGYTVVTPEVIVSREVVHLTQPGLGEGWSLIWVGQDEFVYCLDAAHPEWAEAVDTAAKKRRPFVIFYQDGGGAATTGTCTVGISDAYKVRVTGVELLTDDTDLKTPRPLTW